MSDNAAFVWAFGILCAMATVVVVAAIWRGDR